MQFPRKMAWISRSSAPLPDSLLYCCRRKQWNLPHPNVNCILLIVVKERHIACSYRMRSCTNRACFALRCFTTMLCSAARVQVPFAADASLFNMLKNGCVISQNLKRTCTGSRGTRRIKSRKQSGAINRSWSGVSGNSSSSSSSSSSSNSNSSSAAQLIMQRSWQAVAAIADVSFTSVTTFLW